MAEPSLAAQTMFAELLQRCLDAAIPSLSPTGRRQSCFRLHCSRIASKTDQHLALLEPKKRARHVY
jgi:hypothetical protein